MPVERTGDVFFSQVQGDSSFAVTVPADAELMIVAATGLTGSSTAPDQAFFDALSIGGAGLSDFTPIIRGNWTGSGDGSQVDSYYLPASSENFPAAGAQTLSYSSINGSFQEGVNVVAWFYKGVNPDTPIGDTDRMNSPGGSEVFVADLSGVGANDMCVVVSYDFDTNAQNVDEQTVIVDLDTFNHADFLAVESLNEPNISIDGNGHNPICIAFVVKGVAAEGGGFQAAWARNSNVVIQ